MATDGSAILTLERLPMDVLTNILRWVCQEIVWQAEIGYIHSVYRASGDDTHSDSEEEASLTMFPSLLAEFAQLLRVFRQFNDIITHHVRICRKVTKLEEDVIFV